MKHFGWVRIIGGKWRGRKLKVLALPNLRPTPDRVRETLFNWLSPVIQGAKCLDLFAGSGALGFEALSRGAGSVYLVDKDPEIVTLLNDEKERLGAENAIIFQREVPRQLTRGDQFDIIFIDPPYASNLILDACKFLEENLFLKNPAYIYIESDKPIIEDTLPKNWQLIKAKRAGQVYYHLVRRAMKEF